MCKEQLGQIQQKLYARGTRRAREAVSRPVCIRVRKGVTTETREGRGEARQVTKGLVGPCKFSRFYKLVPWPQPLGSPFDLFGPQQELQGSDPSPACSARRGLWHNLRNGCYVSWH